MPMTSSDGSTRTTSDGLEVKFGLPAEVEFCQRCVVSNQRATPSVIQRDRPGERKATIPFRDGICEACRVVAAKDSIDWQERERELLELLDRYRSSDGSHDCLVPGSGGKDSVFAAHILKARYGMHPLTVTWSPHLYTDVGWRNFRAWIHRGGFDNYLFTADGVTQRRLTRLAYETLLHPFQPFTLGQRNFPVKLAMRMGIGLVFYGENAAEYGSGVGEDSDSRVPERFYSTRGDETPHISGLSLGELEARGISHGSLQPYLPAQIEDIRASGTEVHYLGHFLRWTPQECYYYAVEHTGFQANEERTEGTYSKYNSIDDKMDGFHYWTGYIKFGIGRCTHEASQEIRHGHLTREEGVALVHRFDGEVPRKYLPEVLDYLDLTESEFFEIADRFRSPHLWRHTGDGWELRHRVS